MTLYGMSQEYMIKYNPSWENFIWYSTTEGHLQYDTIRCNLIWDKTMKYDLRLRNMFIMEYIRRKYNKTIHNEVELQ